MISTIVDSINTAIAAGTSIVGDTEFLGIARIHDLDSEKYPAIYLNDSWNRIFFDDQYTLTAYHRVDKIEQGDAEDFDFRGSLNDEVSEVYNMILVIAMNKDYDHAEAVEIKNLIPGTVSNASYGAVFIGRGEIETDEDEIINDEFGDTDYGKYKSDFNIFRINYKVEFINC